MYFFLLLVKAYRIIPEPLKHVFHLVWSVLGISTTIKTASKKALYDCFDSRGKVEKKLKKCTHTKLHRLCPHIWAKNGEENEMKEKLFIWSFVQLVIIWFAERPFKSQRM